MKFPKKIYVKIEGDKGEEYFVADGNKEDLVDNTTTNIATYELVGAEHYKKQVVKAAP